MSRLFQIPEIQDGFDHLVLLSFAKRVIKRKANQAVTGFLRNGALGVSTAHASAHGGEMQGHVVKNA
jgi:hypothetical protein